ncbi:MAG: hypothetical protein MK160_15870, partial [Rhodobacteraceae bacterium]|nr:hypothetical protein [Paracoccaceae bacterium]
MDKFEKLTGIAAPLPLVNIDTDMIIPKQFLKTFIFPHCQVSSFSVLTGDFFSGFTVFFPDDLNFSIELLLLMATVPLICF